MRRLKANPKRAPCEVRKLVRRDPTYLGHDRFLQPKKTVKFVQQERAPSKWLWSAGVRSSFKKLTSRYDTA